MLKSVLEIKKPALGPAFLQHREITSSRLSWALLQERPQERRHQLSVLQPGPEQVPGPEQGPERVPERAQGPERVFRRRRSEQVRERKRGGASVS